MVSFKKFFEKKQASPHDSRGLADNLKLLSEAEANISAFYLLCAEAHPEHKHLWTSMATSESGHAETIRKMASLVARNPGQYRTRTEFNASTIRLFSLRMESLAEKMKAGRIAPAMLFSIANEIEHSSMELNIGELIETGDEEFNSLARRVDAETREHRNSLEKVVREKATAIPLKKPDTKVIKVS